MSGLPKRPLSPPDPNNNAKKQRSNYDAYAARREVHAGSRAKDPVVISHSAAAQAVDKRPVDKAIDPRTKAASKRQANLDSIDTTRRASTQSVDTAHSKHDESTKNLSRPSTGPNTPIVNPGVLPLKSVTNGQLLQESQAALQPSEAITKLLHEIGNLRYSFDQQQDAHADLVKEQNRHLQSKAQYQALGSPMALLIEDVDSQLEELRPQIQTVENKLKILSSRLELAESQLAKAICGLQANAEKLRIESKTSKASPIPDSRGSKAQLPSDNWHFQQVKHEKEIQSHSDGIDKLQSKHELLDQQRVKHEKDINRLYDKHDSLDQEVGKLFKARDDLLKDCNTNTDHLVKDYKEIQTLKADLATMRNLQDEYREREQRRDEGIEGLKDMIRKLQQKHQPTRDATTNMKTPQAEAGNRSVDIRHEERVSGIEARLQEHTSLHALGKEALTSITEDIANIFARLDRHSSTQQSLISLASPVDEIDQIGSTLDQGVTMDRLVDNDVQPSESSLESSAARYCQDHVRREIEQHLTAYDTKLKAELMKLIVERYGEVLIRLSNGYYTQHVKPDLHKFVIDKKSEITGFIHKLQSSPTVSEPTIIALRDELTSHCDQVKAELTSYIDEKIRTVEVHMEIDGTEDHEQTVSRIDKLRSDHSHIVARITRLESQEAPVPVEEPDINRNPQSQHPSSTVDQINEQIESRINDRLSKLEAKQTDAEVNPAMKEYLKTFSESLSEWLGIQLEQVKESLQNYVREHNVRQDDYAQEMTELRVSISTQAQAVEHLEQETLRIKSNEGFAKSNVERVESQTAELALQYASMHDTVKTLQSRLDVQNAQPVLNEVTMSPVKGPGVQQNTKDLGAIVTEVEALRGIIDIITTRLDNTNTSQVVEQITNNIRKAYPQLDIGVMNQYFTSLKAQTVTIQGSINKLEHDHSIRMDSIERSSKATSPLTDYEVTTSAGLSIDKLRLTVEDRDKRTTDAMKEIGTAVANFSVIMSPFINGRIISRTQQLEIELEDLKTKVQDAQSSSDHNTTALAVQSVHAEAEPLDVRLDKLKMIVLEEAQTQRGVLNKLKSLKNDCESLETRLADFESVKEQVLEQKALHGSLIERLDTHDDKLGHLETTSAEHTEHTADLKASVATAKNQYDHMKSLITQHNDGLMSNIKGLEQKSVDIADDVADLSNKVNSLEEIQPSITALEKCFSKLRDETLPNIITTLNHAPMKSTARKTEELQRLFGVNSTMTRSETEESTLVNGKMTLPATEHKMSTTTTPRHSASPVDMKLVDKTPANVAESFETGECIDLTSQ